MAIYHLSIKIISRGKGKSAVAGAAYRAGEKIKNEYDGMIHDYTRKKGVLHTEILLPSNAPIEYADRSILWNAVEKIEKSKNAQLAREIEIAMPAELWLGQNILLVREYCQRHFVSAGMCADICIHDKNNGNPHAHIMLTMRPFEQDGSWAAKSKKEYILDEKGDHIVLKSGEYKTRKINAVDWNEKTKAEEWRQGWADICNAYLDKNDIVERLDHRSFERQGIEQIPTIHLGPAATQMEKKGIRTQRGNTNRDIAVTNQNLRELKARLAKLQKSVQVDMLNEEPATLADYINDILSRKAPEGKSRVSQSIYNLKDAANLMNFLIENKITDMAGLDEKLASMRGEEEDLRKELAPIDRRLKTLADHIQHGENRKAYQKFKSKYNELYGKYEAIEKAGGLFVKHKAQKALDEAKAYYETYRTEIVLFNTAESYLKGVMNGKTKVPLKEWKEEYTELTAQRNGINQKYQFLKDKVLKAEQIYRSIHNIIRQEQRKEKPRKKQEMEL